MFATLHCKVLFANTLFTVYTVILALPQRILIQKGKSNVY